jgi:hypothetical protein
MSDGQSTDRNLEREERRLERLRLVVALPSQPERSEEEIEDFDPDPREAA